MKVEYVQVGVPDSGWSWVWIWRTSSAVSTHYYTRRRDAVRGFERFCAALKKARA